jgi:hypothetical protein
MAWLPPDGAPLESAARLPLDSREGLGLWEDSPSVAEDEAEFAREMGGSDSVEDDPDTDAGVQIVHDTSTDATPGPLDAWEMQGAEGRGRGGGRGGSVKEVEIGEEGRGNEDDDDDDDDEDNDDLVLGQQAADTVSLLDPLLRRPISVPVRGVNCSHLTWFDLSNFFEWSMPMLNLAAAGNVPGKQYRWKCPICRSITGPGDVRVDPLPLAILTAARRFGQLQGHVDTVLASFEPLSLYVAPDGDSAWTPSRLPAPEGFSPGSSLVHAHDPTTGRPVVGHVDRIQFFVDGRYQLHLTPMEADEDATVRGRGKRPRDESNLPHTPPSRRAIEDSTGQIARIRPDPEILVVDDSDSDDSGVVEED